jgi:predicted nucleic-acid-binding Zn-ribbon protein
MLAGDWLELLSLTVRLQGLTYQRILTTRCRLCHMSRTHWHRFPIADLPHGKFIQIVCKGCRYLAHARRGDFVQWGRSKGYVGDVERRLRCSKCGTKGNVEIRVER